MAWDETLAAALRADLSAEAVTEVRMFGGLAFMRAGHMVCGIHAGGVFFRVGKDRLADAIARHGGRQMRMAGRPMGGYLELSPAEAQDGATRRALLAGALAHTATLPPKTARSARPAAKPT